MEGELKNEEELTEDVRLCFINLIGEENDGYYRYEFIFTDDIENVWGENFDQKPSCLVNNLKVDEQYVYEVHIVKMKIKLDLIQTNCCFSISDAYDGCVAIGIENLEGYDSYPEEGRLYFMFGETLDEVEEKLAVKRILMLN